MVNIYIQGELLDQYEDESVEIISSVIDVSDITKINGDYSQSFTVPASKRNNKIFKHWYNASIDNGFDSRTKVAGNIDIDGVPFKTGKWLLQECIIKKGTLESYSINFNGDTANIKDIVGKDKLNTLDLSHLNHPYTNSDVGAYVQRKEGAVVAYPESIIYSSILNRKYFYNDNTIVVADKQDNIDINMAWNGGNGQASNGSGIAWNDFRPSVRCLDIIEAIEDRYSGRVPVHILNITSTAAVAGTCIITINKIRYEIPVTNTTNIGTLTDEVVIGLNSALAGEYTVTVLPNQPTTIEIRGDVSNKNYNPLSTFNRGDATNMNAYFFQEEEGASDSGLEFSRDFFQTTEFERMYLWLNPDLGEDTPIGGGEQIIEWGSSIVPPSTSTPTNAPINLATNIGTYTDRFTPFSGANWSLTLKLQPAAADLETEYTFIIKDGDTIVHAQYLVGSDAQSYNWSYNPGDSKAFSFYIIPTATMTFDLIGLSQTVITGAGTRVISYFTESTGQIFDSGVDLAPKNVLMPDLTIVEFLEGLFKMFKLIAIGDADNKLYVNTLDSYYAQGSRVDITKYIDYEEYTVKRGEILSEIDFTFSEATTILAKEFESRNGVGYGDSVVVLKDENNEPLEGETLEVELPFEQILYERLTNEFDGDKTTIQTGTVVDHELKRVYPEAHLHYAEFVDISQNPIKFNYENSPTDPSAYEIDTNLWMPSHGFGIAEPMYSLLFENEVYAYTGGLVSPLSQETGEALLRNNMYSRHYQDYIKAMFKLNRRTFIYKAILPTYISTTLALNDVIVIKGVDYLINKYSYNLLTGVTSFELVNGYDSIINTDVFIPRDIIISKKEELLYFNVPNISEYTIVQTDTGDGIGWVTYNRVLGDNDNILRFGIGNYTSLNKLGRSMNITLTRGTDVITTTITQKNYNYL